MMSYGDYWRKTHDLEGKIRSAKTRQEFDRIKKQFIDVETQYYKQEEKNYKAILDDPNKRGQHYEAKTWLKSNSLNKATYWARRKKFEDWGGRKK